MLRICAETLLVEVVEDDVADTRIRDHLGMDDLIQLMSTWTDAFNMRSILNPETIQHLFEVIDIDRDGRISEADLNLFLLHLFQLQPSSPHKSSQDTFGHSQPYQEYTRASEQFHRTDA
jgi:Ca2+-binding EF-hand superfamily protein